MLYERFKSNLIYLVIAIVMPLGNIVLSSLVSNPLFIEISYMYLFILLPVIIYILMSKKNIKKVLRLNKVNPEQIFIVLLLVLAIQPLITLAALTMQNLLGDDFCSRMGGMMAMGSDSNLFLSLFIIAITPAICEEVLMRGVVLNGYRNISLWKAAVMNGVLFGLLHNNFMQLPYAAIMGIVLTIVVVLTNSIYPSIIMHFVMNGLSVLMENYPTSIYTNFTMWYGSDMVTLIILSIISLGATVLLIMWLKKVSINHNDDVQVNEENITMYDNKDEQVTFVEWPLMLAVAISVTLSLMW